MKAYYDARAREYDDWIEGVGVYEGRERFLAEARRVAPELVVLDSAWRADVEREELQERLLRDGSRWNVYKRYFDPDQLAEELGGGRTVFAGRWFVVVAA